MSSNFPPPQFTGSPVIVDVEAFVDQKHQKVAEPWGSAPHVFERIRCQTISFKSLVYSSYRFV